jgi:D-alanine-D-alanine ligase-like ATP-grasp enzyme
MEHNRPDVTIVDHTSKVWTFVDFSVPWDKTVVTKEDEKVTHYTPLTVEIRKMHKVSTKIIPIVVGSLGTVSKRLAGYLKQLEIPDVIGGIQTSAIIGTTLILRKTLSL